MAALTDSRLTNVKYNEGDRYYDFEVATGQTIYPGALVMVKAGKAYAAASDADATVYGFSTSAEVKKATEIVHVQEGLIACGGNIALSDVPVLVYVADDQTVTATPGATIAGVVTQVDDKGAWVETKSSMNLIAQEALGT